MAVNGGSPLRGLLLKRLYAAPAASAKKVDNVEKISLAKQDAKTTTLPNGLTVASIENYSPVSRVGVMIKAGPRYEPFNQLGISHYLRNSAGLSTKGFTTFGIVRNIEKAGGSLQASCSRENIFYELNCIRDYLDSSVAYLAETVTQPNFSPWELSDVQSRMKVDLAARDSDPIAVLLEALHKVSFQGGLRNSLYSPDFMLGKHGQTMVQNYISDTFGTDRTAIVGLGVDHDQLVGYVNKYFKLQSTAGSQQGASKFKGGDVYIDSDSPVTYAAIVAEGAGLSNQKDFLCLALLQKVLGDGPLVKYSSSASSKLGAAASKATSHSFAVSGLNISYSDTGLFGFCLACNPKDLDKLLKELVGEMRNLKKVSADDLATAKQRLKSGIQISLESQSNLLEEMAISALTTGQLVTSSDLDKAIDAITIQDVTAAATKVLKGRPSIAALGQFEKTLSVEDLI